MLNGEDRPANDLADPLIQEYALATFASVGEAPYEIRVAITASYDRRRDGECSILAQFERDGAGPLPPVMTLARARVVNAPTIASRHYMTSHARPQVTTATEMFFTCFVARSDGRVHACATRLPTRNTASAAGVDAAYGLATLYRFDLGDIDRDDPTPLQIDIDVRVSPTDIRSLDFLSTPARSADEMVFAHVPDDDERNLIYGLFPLPNGTLTLTCQVQSDMSALCENPRSDDFEIVEILRQRTMRLTLLYKLAPRTRSGERSEGIVFDLPIVLEEYR